MRDLVKKHYIGMNAEFRFRGEEQTRVETLSDAGFALAIGLLLISSSSPNTFDELLEFTKGVIPFALCITLISLVWYQHFIFFIRYGFRNATVVTLNTLLLFIILFYVYPLKFLAKMLVLIYGAMIGNLFGYNTSIPRALEGMMEGTDMPQLMIIYGIGAASIFIVLMLMYRYALKNADKLELNEIEIFDTKVSVYSNMLMAGIPLLSVLFILIIPDEIVSSIISGVTYFLYFPVMLVFGKRADRRRKRLLDTTSADADQAPSV